MKWLLKFIPVGILINFVCDLIKDNFTVKTETTLDDDAVDKVLHPTLTSWWECARDPDITWHETVLRNAFIIINFLDESGLKYLEDHISSREHELEKCIL